MAGRPTRNSLRLRHRLSSVYVETDAVRVARVPAILGGSDLLNCRLMVESLSMLSESPLLALFGHAAISELRLLSGVKRKLDSRLPRAAVGAQRTFDKNVDVGSTRSGPPPVCALDLTALERGHLTFLQRFRHVVIVPYS